MTKFILFSLGLTAYAQVTCNMSVGTTPLLRNTGLSEPIGDVILICTGGSPTVAGDAVPQINVTISLTTVTTSKITAAASTGTFMEALAFVDEPNVAGSSHALLNCGQTGAPDNGPPGPGVCQIVSTGIPTQTYDGSPNTNGIGTCVTITYGCGRPNAFQGRLVTGGGNNSIVFSGLPFDPPGAGTRIIRLTNLRANAFLLAVGPPPAVGQVMADVSISGPTSISISNPEQTVAFIQAGLISSCGTPAASTIRACEGFASSWKTKNLSYFVGDNLANAGNGIFSGGAYTYAGTTHHPGDIAQNIPGVVYNTESLLEWENSSPNGPPTPNPPAGFGFGPVLNLDFPLGSAGYGVTNTNPSVDGVATAGTRLAVMFAGVPPGSSIHVPLTVNIFRQGCTTCVATGVGVLTTTDAAGGGPFSAATSMVVGSSNMAVYEVLFADPFSIEYADVTYHVVGGPSAGVTATATFAPFYADAASAQPSATGFLPRFAAPSLIAAAGLEAVIHGFGLAPDTEASLNGYVNTATADLAASNTSGACIALTDLIGDAVGQVIFGKLKVNDATTLIVDTVELQGTIGCRI